MALKLEGYIDLPANQGKGGFDHADVHARSDRLYVAHTANDALDVIDCANDRYVESVTGLTAVAGALVSQARNLVFTSNRGENTVSIFASGAARDAVKVAVGVKPNGLAFNPGRGVLLAANVGDPAIPGSHTASVVDVEKKERIADVPLPGRTRWTVYDGTRDLFYVNIMSPAKIVALDGSTRATAYEVDVPAAGPHGLDLDEDAGRLFCACDAGTLYLVEIPSGRVRDALPLSGAPDVVFFNPDTKRLYVAVGEPGVIEVIDTHLFRHVETVATEAGAHTFALDRARNRVFAFLPDSHRAAVLRET